MLHTWANREWLNHHGLSHLPQPGNRAGCCGMTDGAALAQGMRHLHGEGGAWYRGCLLWSGKTSRWGLSQPPIRWFWSSQQTVTIPISAGGRAQPWRFLESIDENIQTQVIEETAGRGALLDLTLTKKGRLPEDVRIKGCLDCSDQEMVKLSILRGDSRAKTNIPTLRPLGEKTLVSSGIHLKESHGIEA